MRKSSEKTRSEETEAKHWEKPLRMMEGEWELMFGVFLAGGPIKTYWTLEWLKIRGRTTERKRKKRKVLLWRLATLSEIEIEHQNYSMSRRLMWHSNRNSHKINGKGNNVRWPKVEWDIQNEPRFLPDWGSASANWNLLAWYIGNHKVDIPKLELFKVETFPERDATEKDEPFPK